jgi:hypothetical protein
VNQTNSTTKLKGPNVHIIFGDLLRPKMTEMCYLTRKALLVS